MQVAVDAAELVIGFGHAGAHQRSAIVPSRQRLTFLELLGISLSAWTSNGRRKHWWGLVERGDRDVRPTEAVEVQQHKL